MPEAYIMLDRATLVSEEIDLLIDEARKLATLGPTFKIVVAPDRSARVYRDRITGIFLMCRGREYAIRLSASHLRLFHYLVFNRSCAKTAHEIAWEISNSPSFVRDDGRPWRLARSSIKTFVMRIRRAFAVAFKEAHLTLDAKRVLVSEPTSGNATAFRLRARLMLTPLKHDED